MCHIVSDCGGRTDCHISVHLQHSGSVVRGWCKALGCFGALARTGVVKQIKAMQAPGSPQGKNIDMLDFGWGIGCTPSRDATAAGVWAAEQKGDEALHPQAAFWWGAVGHRMESRRCLTVLSLEATMSGLETVATAEPWAEATSLLVVGCGALTFVVQSEPQPLELRAQVLGQV